LVRQIVLKIWGIEATQAIQYFKSTHPLCTAPGGTKIPCPDNSVPFVAGKQLVLRLYVSGGTPGSRLSAIVTRPTGSSYPVGSTFQLLGLGGMDASATPATRTNNASNGLGNLIVGYNESRVVFGGTDDRTGSHNVVVGEFNNFSSFGGLVVGGFNEISGQFASVSGGTANTASGFGSSVSGGSANTASGDFSSVSGGAGNTASGFFSSVSGGLNNKASGNIASVSGGDENTASGDVSSVSGGSNRTAPGQFNWAAGPLFAAQ
jgi:hypothetical protein